MTVLRVLLSLPWLFLREVLIRTDRDYWRMLAVTGERHTHKGYWDFVEMRQVLERSGQYDRTSKLHWQNLDEDDEPDPEQPEFENKPDPPPEKSKLQQAEELLGLEPGNYDQKALKQAHRKAIKVAHTDRGGTKEDAQGVNDARDIIRNHHGWDK